MPPVPASTNTPHAMKTLFSKIIIA